MERILIVDDDITFGLMLKTWLSKKGFGTQTAASAAAARTALAEGGFSLVLSDMRLPDEDGIALLQWMSGQRIEVPVIVMTSYAEIQNAVRCMKLGARDYVAKPVNPDELLKKIREALDAPAPVGDVPPVTPEKAPETSRAAGGDIPNYIEGQSDAARQLYEYVRLVAPTNMSVLVNGASGTGKEHVAQLIHRQSKRAGKPFVAVDCGAIPRDLAASEFFAARAFWTRWGTLPMKPRCNCCGPCRSAASVPWAATAKSLSTSGWSQRPTKTSKRRSRAGRSVPTSTTVSTNLRSVCPK